MTATTTPLSAKALESKSSPDAGTPIIVGVIGFLTLVDLFATQAILPTIAQRYGASPSEAGLAVNATTFGMAGAGLAVALFGARLHRRIGASLCLALLAIPTALLAVVDDLSTFAALRVAQGAFMATAFSLTMTYLSERCTAAAASTALAAYVTGAVASNLVGRLLASTIADGFGLATSFYVFAALNLVGAGVAYAALRRGQAPMAPDLEPPNPFAVLAAHLRNTCLLAGFAIGFLILFAFIGAFTYVNFVLSRPPIALSPTALGYVYFVFLPAMVSTPVAGAVVARFGARRSFWAGLGLAIASLPLLLAQTLAPILAGLTLFAVGTFFAQATATGFIGRAAKSDRAAASGLYLASYYLGGLIGAAMLGQIFVQFGWSATVGAIGAALGLAALAAATLKKTTAEA